MKYKAKRKMVKARKAIAAGDWQTGDGLITAAKKIDDSPALSYGELRALAKMRRFRSKMLIWLGGLISSNDKGDSQSPDQ